MSDEIEHFGNCPQIDWPGTNPNVFVDRGYGRRPVAAGSCERITGEVLPSGVETGSEISAAPGQGAGHGQPGATERTSGATAAPMTER
jgi:hypothetical protein